MTLKEIHSAIHNHPYRLGGKEEDRKEYISLIDMLLDAFWDEMKKVPHLYACREQLGSFYHDFSACICNLYYHENPDRIRHIERCINTIHVFIDTGDVKEFYTYYAGCNILPTLDRARKHVYIESEKKFISIYKTKELSDTLKHIEEYWEKNGKPDNKWHSYSQGTYDFYKDMLDKYGDIHKGEEIA